MNNRELRAPKKKYFKLEYPTVINALDSLTVTELGEYFKAISEYELYGEEPSSFSDRAVGMAFRMTARELDYQLEKHYGNIERGRENRGGEKDLDEEGSTDLMQSLSADDIKALEAKFTCTDMLIDEVQQQINDNKTIVKSPKRYIEKYAAETDWNRRIEEDAERAAQGLYGG